MARYERAAGGALRARRAELSGAGAAGGAGAALGAVLGAQMRKGIDAVLEAVHFDRLLDGCDLVLTGEGRMDPVRPLRQGGPWASPGAAGPRPCR
jgi:glycerate kinase